MRQYSEWLKLASPLASKVYRQLPPQKGLQQRMTGQLIQWLKKGMVLAGAVQRLIDAYFPKQEPVQPTATTRYHSALIAKPVHQQLTTRLNNRLQGVTTIWAYTKGCRYLKKQAASCSVTAFLVVLHAGNRVMLLPRIYHYTQYQK